MNTLEKKARSLGIDNYIELRMKFQKRKGRHNSIQLKSLLKKGLEILDKCLLTSETDSLEDLIHDIECEIERLK